MELDDGGGSGAGSGAAATRQEVYAAIDGERAYQATRWNTSTTATGGKHEDVTSWLVFMRDYVEEALHFLSRNGEPGATRFALHNVRKVTALGVACMETLGAPRREGS